MDSRYFKNLPFAPNKGEALIIETGLPEGFILKKGNSIIPFGNGKFWVGSSYEWTFTDKSPTALFRQRTEAFLNQFLKIPYTVTDHLAAVRPATIERRPFVGFHPRYKQIGILNGMGTKGCSMAPYFAAQLVNHIKTGSEIIPEANIQRFTRILSF